MRLASLAVLAAGLSSTALAADLDMGPLRGTQYGSAPAIHSWDGAYAGGFAGYGAANLGALNRPIETLIAEDYRRTYLQNEHRISELTKIPDIDTREKVFGAFAGYNMQIDEVVLGIELDYTRGRMFGEGSNEIGRYVTVSNGWGHEVFMESRAETEIREYGTLRARAGYTFGSIMPFVTAGVAVGRADVSSAVRIYDGSHHIASRSAWLSAYQLFLAGEGVEPMPFTAHRGYSDFDPRTGTGTILPNDLKRTRKGAVSVGLSGGLGVDFAVTQNLFLRAEWQYVHFADFAGTSASINNLRAGAGLKF